MTIHILCFLNAGLCHLCERILSLLLCREEDEDVLKERYRVSHCMLQIVPWQRSLTTLYIRPRNCFRCITEINITQGYTVEGFQTEQQAKDAAAVQARETYISAADEELCTS
jgi:hypothetical protein